eukprot:gnl/MRDRNA2_/MRDRNA2_104741_c0_seq1.p1 gnl/MRDRNA2_/MRDRNA2_104741_c0~~gnl/MRDRNA2_/MRDRNA2_104741_c0_seq1.p1  ORF type:complete len:400 (-),score=88.06 gnl/MRDRNA2_/MRDRNA2_104741_c0_seq1:30-1229(-)
MVIEKLSQDKDPKALTQAIEQSRAILQKAPDTNDVKAVLSALENLKGLGPLPISIMRETQIGKIVNGLVKTGMSDEVCGQARFLVDSWKQAVSAERQTSGTKRSVSENEQPGPGKKMKTIPEEFSAVEEGRLTAESSTTTSTAITSGSSTPASVSSPKPDSVLTAAVYRERLVQQRKYQDTKPGSSSLDGCLKDPPGMPPVVEIYCRREAEPKRDKDGTLFFVDHPEFRPNLTPEQVLRAGAFGGTYFRSIDSAVTGISYKGCDVIKEFPSSWFAGLNLEEQVTSKYYRKTVNKYGVACGGSLGQWETSGWISTVDPYGWFQWYCRFYLGRRSSDDARQIDRWLKGEGPKGRWRLQLMNKIIKDRRKYDDVRTSPVMRQVLLHWAYELTSEDLEAYCEK